MYKAVTNRKIGTWPNIGAGEVSDDIIDRLGDHGDTARGLDPTQPAQVAVWWLVPRALNLYRNKTARDDSQDVGDATLVLPPPCMSSTLAARLGSRRFFSVWQTRA